MRPAPSVDGPSRARDASESIARDPFHQAIPLVTPVVDLPRPRRASCPLVRFGCFMPADVLRTRVTRHDRWSGLLSLGHWRGAGEDSAGSGHLPDRRSDRKPRMLRPRLMKPLIDNPEQLHRLLKGVTSRNIEPDGPANRTQPFRPEANRTSSAVGSRR